MVNSARKFQQHLKQTRHVRVVNFIKLKRIEKLKKEKEKKAREEDGMMPPPRVMLGKRKNPVKKVEIKVLKEKEIVVYDPLAELDKLNASTTPTVQQALAPLTATAAPITPKDKRALDSLPTGFFDDESK